MKNIKISSFIILFLVVFQSKGQSLGSYEIIELEFQTFEKESNNVIIASVIELLSDGKQIGVIHGDFDGISKFKVCSRKITNEQITIKVYGIKCKPFHTEYKVNKSLKIKIYLEYGETKYKTLDDRNLILSELNIPFCDLEMDDLIEDEINNGLYQHCDGRIKEKNEIPNNELLEWEKIEN